MVVDAVSILCLWAASWVGNDFEISAACFSELDE